MRRNSACEEWAARRRKLAPLLWPFAIATAVQHAGAGAQPIKAQDILITGTHTASPVDTQVIEMEAINRYAPATLLQPLARLPAVQTLSKAGRSFLSVRGGEPNFTVTIINGARVNDPTSSDGGTFDFEHIAPELVERVEVLPSALSAVYGPDALAGVVMIRMRASVPQGDESELRGYTDLTGGGSAAALLGVSSSGFRLLGAISAFKSSQGSDRFTRRQGMVHASADVGAYGISLLALGSRTHWGGFPEASGGPLYATSERELRRSRLTLAGIEFGPVAEQPVELHASLGWSAHAVRSDTPAIPSGVLDGVPAITANDHFQRADGTAYVLVRRPGGLRLALGGSLAIEDGRSAGSIDFGTEIPTAFRLRRTTRGAFAELGIAKRRYTGSLGVRYDRFAGVGSKLTGRVGVRLPLSRNADAVVEIANGFKLPSFFALAYPLIANPDLRPERGRTASIGVDRHVTAGVIRARLYDSRYKDLIDFDPELLKNVNRSHVRSRGAELESELELSPQLSSRVLLSYNQLRNETGAPPLRSRPRWRAAAELLWSPSASWQFSLLSRLSSGSYDSSVPTGSIWLRGYAVVDAAVEWHASKLVRVQGSVRNLTRERYQQVVGVPAPGRSATLALVLTV